MDKLGSLIAAVIGGLMALGSPTHHQPMAAHSSHMTQTNSRGNHQPTDSGMNMPMDGNGSMNMPMPTNSPGSAMGQQQTAAGMPYRNVTLVAMPAGTVDLSIDRGTGDVVAVLDAFGFSPNSTHRIALYQGRDGGGPIATFSDVTADANGRLALTVNSGATMIRSLPATSLFFQVDRGATLHADAGQTPEIAVAHEVLRPTAPGHVTLQFTSTLAQPGTQLAGKTTLSYDKARQTLTVTISATGLAPNTTHAAHIHSGSCQLQGPVVYGLSPDLAAGADGTASATYTITGVTTPPAQGSYVNVHTGQMSPDLATHPILFQPLLCGNVTAN